MEQITITRLGHHGDGIADGPIYAPLTLPGEVVTGEIIGDRMASPSILGPAPERVKPACAHFKACGGCALMHGADDFVAAWKTQVIADALAAHGLLEVPMRPILTSPARSRRRAVLAGTRTKKGALVGFHGRKSGAIVPISDCHLLHPDIMRALPALEGLTRIGASRSGELRFALTLTDTGLDLVVEGGKPLDPALRQGLPPLARPFARLTWGAEQVVMEARPLLGIGPARVSPPPGAFLQATPEGEAALQQAVAEAIGSGTSPGAARVLDLFSGLGTFTFPTAQNAAVHAVEGDANLIAALRDGADHVQGLRPITTETRDLFRRPLLPDELTRFDAVIIDPPRAGAEAQVAELARAGVPVIAMVSCNPVTFARDTATLTQAGYVLDWVQPVDQFRWSSHVELAARLSLRHIGG